VKVERKSLATPSVAGGASWEEGKATEGQGNLVQVLVGWPGRSEEAAWAAMLRGPVSAPSGCWTIGSASSRRLRRPEG